MLAAFALLESRANAAVVASLSNRLVTVGAFAFTAIFEDAGTVALSGLVETVEPRLMGVTDVARAALPHDALLTIVHPVSLAAVQLKFVRSEPDGSGFHTLYLRKP
ncbi:MULTISPECIES: hypothetical protein [unclassified Variovorax]|uniref:hypothetical protein n=1 Tax=unclassified Variovorax TaxID=663243 RepID=UPI0025771809|nr:MULTISPECIES: hypothetical protein [unclassified Variovorax]MDM0086754.1 hypothetical protein [Variovorax sp. J22G40]MDM0144990.1 hypothetical protein [Variovorax sp. J2P1-31]